MFYSLLLHAVWQNDMDKIGSYIINILFFTIITVLAVSVATIAITKKVNEYNNRNTQGIIGVIVKEKIPVVALTKGVVQKVEVKTGDVVKKDELLVKLENPLLKSKVKSLKDFKNNASAQTEAKVGEEQLKNLNIVSPVDGIVGDIGVTEGSVVEELSKTLEIYSNNNIRLLVPLSVDEYQVIQKEDNIRAYSERLNQSFPIKEEKLKPEAEKDEEMNKKKLGLYFIFVDPTDGIGLVDNEELEIKITKDEQIVRRPVDIFIDFWNGLISGNK